MPDALLDPPTADAPCLTLVGMAGAGKSTLGRSLAQALGWAHLDTDSLLEAHAGGLLADIYASLGREAFLEMEDAVVAALSVRRTVISTGGSVIYGRRAMRRLASLGPVVYVSARAATIEARVDPASHRGLAIRPGQTLAELLAEREPLYRAAAAFEVATDDVAPEAACRQLFAWFQPQL